MGKTAVLTGKPMSRTDVWYMVRQRPGEPDECGGGLGLSNGQTTSVTPGGGTLTISSTGQLTLSSNGTSGTTLSITGNVNNTGQLNLSSSYPSFTTLSITGNVNNSGSFTEGTTLASGGSTVNVTGKFTNNSGATLSLAFSQANIGTLVNSGTVNVFGVARGGPNFLYLTAVGDGDGGSGSLLWYGYGRVAAQEVACGNTRSIDESECVRWCFCLPVAAPSPHGLNL